ncbi:MAG: hypothetical protein ACWGNV_16470, partial [Bacteroidales bacterium]
MKKFFTILLVSILSLTLVKAQESSFDLGDNVVSLGIGFGSSLYSGSLYSSGVPPISISFEHGIVDDILEKGVIGIGGTLGYTSYKYRYVSDWGYNVSNIFFGVGGTFHYPFLDKLDTYAGLMLGYRITSYKEYGNPIYDYTGTSSGFQFAGFIGARYYFTDAEGNEIGSVGR